MTSSVSSVEKPAAASARVLRALQVGLAQHLGIGVGPREPQRLAVLAEVVEIEPASSAIWRWL